MSRRKKQGICLQCIYICIPSYIDARFELYAVADTNVLFVALVKTTMFLAREAGHKKNAHTPRIATIYKARRANRHLVSIIKTKHHAGA